MALANTESSGRKPLTSGTGVPSSRAPPAPHSVADPVDQSPGHSALRGPPQALPGGPLIPTSTGLLGQLHPRIHPLAPQGLVTEKVLPAEPCCRHRKETDTVTALVELTSRLSLSRGRAKGRGLRCSVRFYRRAIPSLGVDARLGRCQPVLSGAIITSLSN